MKIGIHPPRLAKPTDVYVIPNGGFWSVKIESDRYNHATFATKTEALGLGVTMAREAASMLFISNRFGTITDTRDYSRAAYFAD